MPVAERMQGFVEQSVTVKRMFEEGARLKAIHGDSNVFDFSLGNPDLPPPPEFTEALKGLILEGAAHHGYMPTAGHLSAREKIADQLSREHNLDIKADMLIMTVGASGALNNVLKALVNPGDEILTPAPFFVGYRQYAFVADAELKTAPTTEDFHLNIEQIESALTPKTKVVLINSPNNPTGTVYSENEMNQLGQLLEETSRRNSSRIYLVADEPYRKIVYDTAVPSVFNAYTHSIVVNSFSKDLSLAGERIGYLAVNPTAEDAESIIAAAGAANTMYVVNAPSLFQLAVAKAAEASVDVSIYKRRRDMLCDVLYEAGYEFSIPQGAFYLFPQSPLADDLAFTGVLKENLILVTPGAAFGGPGYFRLSYAVPEATIKGSLTGFKKALTSVK